MQFTVVVSNGTLTGETYVVHADDKHGALRAALAEESRRGYKKSYAELLHHQPRMPVNRAAYRAASAEQSDREYIAQRQMREYKRNNGHQGPVCLNADGSINC